jgi:hypothetical protein
VAPHAPPVVQAAEQQRVPVPVAPQTLLEHWSFAVHARPAFFLATHVPEAPGFWQKSPAMHWESAAHAVRHAVPPVLHVKLPPHAAGAPAVQEPAPLHVLIVTVLPGVGHDEPQIVAGAGNTQAPVASQSDAPHVPPTGLHVAAQQCVPAPIGPHTPAAH